MFFVKSSDAIKYIKSTGIKEYYKAKYKGININYNRLKSNNLIDENRSDRHYNSARIFETVHYLLEYALDTAERRRTKKKTTNEYKFHQTEYLRLYMMVIPKCSHHEILALCNIYNMEYGINFNECYRDHISILNSLSELLFSITFNSIGGIKNTTNVYAF